MLLPTSTAKPEHLDQDLRNGFLSRCGFIFYGQLYLLQMNPIVSWSFKYPFDVQSKEPCFAILLTSQMFGLDYIFKFINWHMETFDKFDVKH
jgi:hypothetical protein